MVGSAGAFVDARTLPDNGTYAVVVDPQSANTGAATLTLYDVPPDSGGRSCRADRLSRSRRRRPARTRGCRSTAPRASASAPRRERDDAERVRVARQARRQHPRTKTLFGSAGGFVDVRSLPSAGRYELLVDPLAAGTGSATVTLYDVPPT